MRWIWLLAWTGRLRLRQCHMLNRMCSHMDFSPPRHVAFSLVSHLRPMPFSRLRLRHRRLSRRRRGPIDRKSTALRRGGCRGAGTAFLRSLVTVSPPSAHTQLLLGTVSILALMA